MPRGNTHIETELASGLRLLEEFAKEDRRAANALTKIAETLRAPMPNPRKADRRLPKIILSWETRIRDDGRGGRRTTAEYIERARDLGLTLPVGIGWEAARDAVRAWEIATAEIEETHYLNLFMGDRWNDAEQ